MRPAVRAKRRDFGRSRNRETALRHNDIIYCRGSERKLSLFFLEKLLVEDPRVHGLGIPRAGLPQRDDLIGNVHHQLIHASARDEFGLPQLQLVDAIVSLGDTVMDNALEASRGAPI